MAEGSGQPEIGRRIARGISWSAAGQLGTELLRVVTGFVLARFMTPAEFGLVGMVTVLANYANVVLNFGFGTALVQRKEITEDDLSTVFWLNLGMGVGFTALFVALAPAMAWLYATPELEPIAAALAANFLFLSLGFVQRRRLERELRFDVLARIELVGALASSVAAVLVAVAGGRVWSLVVWTLSRALVVTLGTWIANRWRPAFRFSTASLLDMWSFAANVFASETLNYFGANIDRFLIGQFLGATALGLYEQATRLVLLPVANVSLVLARVLMPAFSRIQDDPEAIVRLYLRGTRTAMFVAAPAMIGLAAAGHHFVAVAYGPGWEGLPPVLAVTGLTGVALTQNAFQTSVFRSRGRADVEFRLGAVQRVLAVPGTLIGLQWTVVTAALGRMVTVFLAFLVMQFAIARVIPAPVARQWANVLPSLACVIAMYFGVWAVDARLGALSHPVALLIDVGVGVVVYVAAALLVREPSLRELVTMVRARVGPRRSRA